MVVQGGWGAFGVLRWQLRCTMAAAAGLVKVSMLASLRDSQLLLVAVAQHPDLGCGELEPPLGDASVQARVLAAAPLPLQCMLYCSVLCTSKQLLSHHCAVCVVFYGCFGSARCKACQCSQQTALLCKQGGMFPCD